MPKYAAMVQSFRARGFAESNTEFFYVDNTKGNSVSAAHGINAMIREATTDVLVICHQDIEAIDTISILRAKLEALSALDEHWALAGNAGATPHGKLVFRISDPHNSNIRSGDLPERVVSVDENLIVLRRDAVIGVSADLPGYHLYGTDLCLSAERRGLSAYVIDFHVMHKSAGNMDRKFHEQTEWLLRRHRAFCRTRWLRTPCTEIPLSRSRTLSFLMTKGLRFWRGFLRRALPKYLPY